MATKIPVPKYGSTNKDGSINRFDPNTGKSTAPKSSGSSSLGKTYSDSQGQYFYDKSSADASTSKYNPTKTIAYSDVTTPFKEIATTEDTNNTSYDFNGLMKGIQAGTVTGADTVNFQNQILAQNTQDQIDATQKAYNEKPTREEIYNESYKKSGKEKAQKVFNEQQAKLNQIITESQAAQLSLTGQGRGVSEKIIGGQQAQIAKEAAINALPVSAALQIAQGNLEMANENLETLFKIKSEDADNDFAYKVKQIDTISQFATTAQKNQMDSILKIEERKYNETKENTQFIKSIALEAAKNGASGSTLKKISEATDISSAIQAAGSSLATAQNEVIDVNGTKMLVDKKSGRVIKSYGNGTNPGIVQRTVNGSPVEGYSLISGDDPYFIAQKYGINMQRMKELNPNISDWNNLKVGTVLNVPSTKASQIQAIEVILGSGKFTKEQKADLTNAISSGQDPFTVIKNQAKNTMGQTAATDLGKYETAKAQLESIDSLLQQYYSKGGKSNIFIGNYEKTINKLGELQDPELVGIATNIAAALQIYRNAVSGTAYSVQEGRDIASIFPGINKTQGLNDAIISGRMKAFDTTIDASYKNTLGSAYDDLKSTSTVKVDPLQNIASYGDKHPEARTLIIQMQNDGRTIEEINSWVNQNISNNL